jgi:hypothetical protein
MNVEEFTKGSWLPIETWCKILVILAEKKTKIGNQ